MIILERSEHLLSVQDQIVGTDDRNNYNELQINFCGVLTVCSCALVIVYEDLLTSSFRGSLRMSCAD